LPFLPSCVACQVFKTFREISAMSGSKSGDRKRGAIVKLLAAAKREEAGYVMRALQVGPPAHARLLPAGGQRGSQAGRGRQRARKPSL
jgi:hypothetical protein